MEFIKAETDHVTGLIGKSETRPRHSFGVYRASRRAPAHYGEDGLKARRWLIQGCGTSAITWPIFLYKEGPADRDRYRPRQVKNVVDDYRAKAVAPDDIYGVEAQHLRAVRVGESSTIRRFRSSRSRSWRRANNQLAEGGVQCDWHGAKGIKYAPD